MAASRLKLLFVVWVVAETLAFIGVAELVGVGGAILLGLATSLLGAALLKRVGRAALLQMRGTLAGRGGRPGAVLDATLRALSAAALLLPGFLGDILGLALAVPPVRAMVVRRLRGDRPAPGFGEAGPRHGPGAIDLSPEEWSSGSPPAPR